MTIQKKDLKPEEADLLKALPEEEARAYEKQLGLSQADLAIIDAPIRQEQQPEEQQIFDLDNPDDYFITVGAKAYRHYAGFDTYDIEMVDGSTIKYTGLFPTVSEYEDLEDMRIEIIARTSLDYETDAKGKIIRGKVYSLVEIRQLEKLWLDKLAQCYLFNTKTKKPMTRTERRNCKYQHVIYAILKSKLKRSNNDNGPVGKN